ncbi:hypothetical protein ACLEPN_29605 [Myxococcus sp. 1LA]
MNYESLANLFWNTVAFIALIWAVYGAYVPTLKAEFRHDLFSLRRELFLLMAEGKVDREDPSYVRLRQLINGLLREAEIITGFTTVIVSVGILRSGAAKAPIISDEDLNATKNPQARAELTRIRQEINRAIRRHLVRLVPVSPSLWVLSTVGTILLLPAFVRAFAQGARDGWSKGWREAQEAKSRKLATPAVEGLTASALSQAVA